MKINIFKPENNKKHIVQITANVMTLATAGIIIEPGWRIINAERFGKKE